jgi:hypothetical protein
VSARVCHEYGSIDRTYIVDVQGQGLFAGPVTQRTLRSARCHRERFAHRDEQVLDLVVEHLVVHGHARGDELFDLHEAVDGLAGRFAAVSRHENEIDGPVLDGLDQCAVVAAHQLIGVVPIVRCAALVINVEIFLHVALFELVPQTVLVGEHFAALLRLFLLVALHFNVVRASRIVGQLVEVLAATQIARHNRLAARRRHVHARGPRRQTRAVGRARAVRGSEHELIAAGEALRDELFEQLVRVVLIHVVVGQQCQGVRVLHELFVAVRGVKE